MNDDEDSRYSPRENSFSSLFLNHSKIFEELCVPALAARQHHNLTVVICVFSIPPIIRV